MGLLESLFGTLKCLLCGQQQDSSELYRQQHPQYGAIPNRISVQPPATQRLEVPRPARFQQQQPQDETEQQNDPPEPYQQHQLRREPRPYNISFQSPDRPQPRPSYTQWTAEASPPAPYQQQQPQYEAEQQRDSPELYQPHQLRREPRPYCVSFAPPARPHLHTQQVREVHSSVHQPQYGTEQPESHPEPHQLREREPRPYCISFAPPARHTQHVESRPLALYQQQPQYETERQQDSPEPHQHHQRQQEPRPNHNSFQPPATPQLPIQHIEVHPPAPYQQLPQNETEPFILVQRSAKLRQRPLHTHGLGQSQVDQQKDCWSSLRERATEEGKAREKSMQESHQAHANGDHAQAKALSDKSKRHRAEMKRLNKEASEAIFKEHNKDSRPDERDLHGLYVEEAIAFTKRFVQEARSCGYTQISLIVGKGRHSGPAGARIKPAIEGLMRKCNLVAKVHPLNAGILIVSLDGQTHGTGRVGRSSNLRGPK